MPVFLECHSMLPLSLEKTLCIPKDGCKETMCCQSDHEVTAEENDSLSCLITQVKWNHCGSENNTQRVHWRLESYWNLSMTLAILFLNFTVTIWKERLLWLLAGQWNKTFISLPLIAKSIFTSLFCSHMKSFVLSECVRSHNTNNL